MKIIAMAMLCIVAMLCGCAVSAGDVISPSERIHDSVQLITSTAGNERNIQASRLVKFVGSLNEEQIATLPDSAIDDLISLLSDDSNTIKHYAAVALGSCGPRAKRAVPILERQIVAMEAEAEMEPFAPAMTPARQLYIALNRIDGRPLPESVSGTRP